MYLDEVSVYSLTSSPDHPPAAAMSETMSTESKSDWGTSLELGTQVLAKAGAHAAFGSADATGLEIQRRFNVQSLFAVLHRQYSDTFRLRRGGDSGTIIEDQATSVEPDDLSQDQLTDVLRTYRAEGRAVPVLSLRRGDLIELPVALSAHAVFAMVTTVQGIGGLLEKFPGLADGVDSEGVRTALDVAAALEDLMVGLVPVEGVATKHQVLVVDAEVWIVDKDLFHFDSRLAKVADNAKPLQLVGVTERERYWKDTRRVLHADQEFDVLARVSVPDLQYDWSPIKMVHAFDKAVPGLGTGFSKVIKELPASMQSSSAPAPQARLQDATSRLSRLFADLYQVALDQSVAGARAAELSSSFVVDDLESQLVFLWRFLDELHDLVPGLERDIEAEADMRQDALRLASASSERAPEVESNGKVRDEQPSLLEVEFVGIYW